MKKGPLLDQRGVEPTVMKLMAGIILLAIGLGVGISLYLVAAEVARLTFQVTLSPGSVTIGIPENAEKDNIRNVIVSIERLGDYDRRVTLSKTGVPGNVRVEFSPDHGTPSFGSTMTITVDNTVTWTGTTTITIRATGEDGVEKTASFVLTIVK